MADPAHSPRPDSDPDSTPRHEPGDDGIDTGADEDEARPLLGDDTNGWAGDASI